MDGEGDLWEQVAGETPLPHEERPLALAQLQAQPLVLGFGEVWSCAGAAECLWQLAGD